MKYPYSFSYVREKIQEWRHNGWLLPVALRSQERFRTVASREMRPAVQQLLTVLRSEGVQAELIEDILDQPGIELHLPEYDAAMSLWPSENPTRFYLSIQASAQGRPQISRISYCGLSHGRLEYLLQESVLTILAPTRA